MTMIDTRYRAKQFARPELQREIRQRGGDEDQHHHAEEVTKDRGVEGDVQPCVGSARLLGRIAVQDRGRRPGGARHPEHDRRDRAAEQPPLVDAHEHPDGRGGVHGEDERQQHRHRHVARYAGHGAHGDTQEHAEGNRQQHLWAYRDVESQRKDFGQ
jgi:hypothetical protein